MDLHQWLLSGGVSPKSLLSQVCHIAQFQQIAIHSVLIQVLMLLALRNVEALI